MMLAARRRAATAIASRSRTFGHIVTTVPSAIIKPARPQPEHQRRQEHLESDQPALIVDSGQHHVEVDHRRRTDRDLVAGCCGCL